MSDRILKIQFCYNFQLHVFFQKKLIGFSWVISAYHHLSCEFESRSWRGVLNTILSHKVCQWLVVGWWFSSGTPVSSTNKTDRHDITEIMLNVALNHNRLFHNLFCCLEEEFVFQILFFSPILSLFSCLDISLDCYILLK